jgi:hypothetical protein
MPITRTSGRKKLSTEKTFTHHVFSATDKPCNPYEILTGREAELHPNVIEKLKRVAAEGIGAVTGCFYEIAHVALMKS